MTAPSVSERLRELAEEIKDGPTFDPTRRDHMSTVRVLEALATEIEAIAHVGRVALDENPYDDDLPLYEALRNVTRRLAPRKEGT